MPETVKVVRFHEFGNASVLQLEQLPLPEPAGGEVRLGVKAIGLNRADIMFREGKYVMLANELPAKLGVEAAGIVEAVGPGVDPSWIGKAANCIATFHPAQYGVYGEAAILPVSAIRAYPPRLSFQEAASVWAQYLTAWGGLVHFGGLRSGDIVLITAASSSTGLAAIETVKAEGAISIATTRTASKRQELLELGADHVIVTEEEDLVSRVMEITDGRGARLIYDPIGGENLTTLVEVASRKAIIVEYGLLSDAPTVLPLFSALVRFLTIKAYDVHEIFEQAELLRSGTEYVLSRLYNGSYKPKIGNTFPLEAIAEAHRYMESNVQIGKTVVMV